jgi:hypothetical protein
MQVYIPPHDPVSPIMRTIQDFLHELGNRMWAGLGPAVGDVLDWFDELDRIARTADVLARKYRWGLSTTWPPALVAHLGRLAEGSATATALNQAVFAYYRADDWCELDALVEGICSREAIAAVRRSVLRHTVKMIRASEAGAFNAATFALPTLFSELEGICHDIAAADPSLNARLAAYVASGRRPNIARFVARELRPSAARIERHGLHLIEKVVFKNHNNVVPKRGRRLSRNVQQHGRGRAPRRLAEVVRILLMIDLVAYLADARRGVVSEDLEARRTWGDYLSQASVRGHKSLTRGTRPSEVLFASKPWRRTIPTATVPLTTLVRADASVSTS